MNPETATRELSVRELIEALKTRVMDGGEVVFEEAVRLLGIKNGSEDFDALLAAAREITFQYNTDEPGLCALVNAKSNLCGEDCSFCSQSVRYDTRVSTYKLMPVDEIVKAAKKFESSGTQNFCIVTSGAALNDEEFEHILETYRRLGEETSMNLDGSLGFLTLERVKRLKEAGVRRINSNLQTSREHYPSIVSTHSYETRLDTLRQLRSGELEICSGGILGLGETRTDRLRLAFELKPFKPRCLPVNILNPRPGTPLENQPKEDPLEMIKTIAVFRFIHPRSNIKLAGGREYNLGDEYQELALRGGANGMITGGYLTTEGNPVQADLDLLERTGFKVPEPRQPADSLPS